MPSTDYFGETALKQDITSRADPGFLLGGGAPLRNGLTNTNKPLFSFAEYQLY